MLFFIIGVICLHICGAFMLFPSEYYHLLFGDLFNMKDLYLFDNDTDDTTYSNNTSDGPTLEELLSDDAYSIVDPETIYGSFKNPIEASDGPDKKLFDKLNLEVYNSTRRFVKGLAIERYEGYLQPYNPKENVKDKRALEFEKVHRTRRMGFQLLIHSRYKVLQAMNHRSVIRQDKRYQLGYLFNRLRRTRIEMLKLIGHAHGQWLNENRTNRFMVYFRCYEQVVFMEMDVRDTIKYIKEVYARDTEYDYMTDPPFATEAPDPVG